MSFGPGVPALCGLALVLLGGSADTIRRRVDSLVARGRLPAPRRAPARAAVRGALRRARRVSAAALPRRAVLLPVTLAGLVTIACAAGPLAVEAEVILLTGALLGSDALKARRRACAEAQADEAVRLVAAELEAGAAVDAALDAAAQAVPVHRRDLHAAAECARMADVEFQPLVAHDVSGLAALGHGVRVSAACGAPLSVVLAKVSGEAAAAAQRRRELAAAVAGPKASCVLLAVLPVLGTALGVAMGAHPARFLLATPAGAYVGCAGAVLDALGVLWVRHLVRSAVPP